MNNNINNRLLKLTQALSWLKLIGIQYLYTKDPQNIKNMKKEMHLVKPVNADHNDSKVIDHSAVSRNIVNNITSLTELKKAVENFDGCELKNFASNTVFSDGVSDAKIMLIGEAPGANEDALGIPFCGESGKLLDKMLASINLSRKENVYITNTVFWRPPGNRAPTDMEIAICKPFIEKHIALIEPRLIVLVGSTAATGLLGKHAGITKIRQEYYNYSNQYLKTPITTTAIFHPAYLLRQPTQKKVAWNDLLKIQQFIIANSILK